MQLKNLAIVPARKGSSGLPGKNALKLGGQSITLRALECAKASGVFSEILLSSDWDVLLEEAKAAGFKTHLRPISLADGEASVDDVVTHILRETSEPYDTVCVLNPTTPFRAPQDIVAAYKLFNKLHPQGVVSVTPVKPLFMSRLRKGKRSLWHNANFSFRNRQRRKPMYAQNGALYIVDRKYIEETGRLVGDKVAVYEMPKRASLDLDDAWDWLSAEAWYSEHQKIKGQEIYDVKPEPPSPASSPVTGETVPDGGPGAGSWCQ